MLLLQSCGAVCHRFWLLTGAVHCVVLLGRPACGCACFGRLLCCLDAAAVVALLCMLRHVALLCMLRHLSSLQHRYGSFKG